MKGKTTKKKSFYASLCIIEKDTPAYKAGSLFSMYVFNKLNDALDRVELSKSFDRGANYNNFFRYEILEFKQN